MYLLGRRRLGKGQGARFYCKTSSLRHIVQGLCRGGGSGGDVKVQSHTVGVAWLTAAAGWPGTLRLKVISRSALEGSELAACKHCRTTLLLYGLHSSNLGAEQGLLADGTSLQAIMRVDRTYSGQMFFLLWASVCMLPWGMFPGFWACFCCSSGVCPFRRQEVCNPTLLQAS